MGEGRKCERVIMCEIIIRGRGEVQRGIDRWIGQEKLRKEKLRIYYQKNKEIILERAREWNKKNKGLKENIFDKN